MTDQIVFTTVHGSRLYGLNHADSDDDSMIVYNDKRKPLHVKRGDLDVIHVGLPWLLDNAYKGSVQFVEAVFSHDKVWTDPSWRPMFDTMRIPVAAVRETFTRTIRTFVHMDTQKSRQHAVRLGLALHDIRVNDGWYDPKLTERQQFTVRALATLYRGDDLLKAIEEIIL